MDNTRATRLVQFSILDCICFITSLALVLAAIEHARPGVLFFAFLFGVVLNMIAPETMKNRQQTYFGGFVNRAVAAFILSSSFAVLCLAVLVFLFVVQRPIDFRLMYLSVRCAMAGGMVVGFSCPWLCAYFRRGLFMAISFF